MATFTPTGEFYPVHDPAKPYPGRVWWRGAWRLPSSERGIEALAKGGTVIGSAEPRTSYAKPEYDVTDPTTGHKIKPRPEPIKQRKARIDGPTATYIVAFVNTASHPTRPGIVERVKVGTTITKNRSTYGVTLGLDVKECVPPEIHPDRLTAEARALVIESKLDLDGMFVRVADEAFAPTISLTYDELVAWVEGAIYDEHV